MDVEAAGCRLVFKIFFAFSFFVSSARGDWGVEVLWAWTRRTGPPWVAPRDLQFTLIVQEHKEYYNEKCSSYSTPTTY